MWRPAPAAPTDVPWIFHLQILLTCGPMAGAMALKGSSYYLGMALLTLLYFLGLERITTRLQQFFSRACRARTRAALAGQFDTALNNMPHGLCMFGADGRLAVINHRFSEMMSLADDLVHRGVCAAMSSPPASAAERFRRKMDADYLEIENSQAGGIVAADLILARGRVAVLDVPADGGRRRGCAG